jgi:hypothetical protein
MRCITGADQIDLAVMNPGPLALLLKEFGNEEMTKSFVGSSLPCTRRKLYWDHEATQMIDLVFDKARQGL